jgi:hypothetical protein
MRSRFSSMFIAAAATLTIASSASYAHAVGDAAASPTRFHKGIVGGALLGGEAVTLVEAVVGVRSPWAYVVGGAVGAAGGGIAGHFVERDATSARGPMFMLAGGVTLVIPTIVAILSRTAYRPPANYVQDRAPADEPVAEPPQPAPPGSYVPAPSSRLAPKKPSRHVRHVESPEQRLVLREPVMPPSLVDFNRGLVSLSVPTVELREVYSRQDLLQMGLKQATEVRIPVVNFTF